jgi:hypothetical protein
MTQFSDTDKVIDKVIHILNGTMPDNLKQKIHRLCHTVYPYSANYDYVMDCLTVDADYTYHLCQDVYYMFEFNAYCKRVYDAIQYFIKKNNIHSQKYGGCREMYIEYDSNNKSLYESEGEFKVEEFVFGYRRRGTKEDPFDVFSRCDLPSLTTIINTLLFQYGVALTIIKPVFAIGDRRYMLQLTW